MADAAGPGTLCAAFQATVARYPDQVALGTPGGAVTLTWGQYGQRVRQVAAGLAGLGVGRGATVGLKSGMSVGAVREAD
jgi:long-chain acyl-CoA synthetase